MYEKRVHIRVPVGIEGSYQPTTRLAAPRLGMTRDISLGGARFASSDRLEPGDKISLSLSLPKEGEMVLTGVVVWSRIGEQRAGQAAYESGLCWENVDAHAQARLNSFLTDYTRSDGSTVIVSSAQAASPLSWYPRAIAAGLGASLLLWGAAVVWLRIHDLNSETRSLRAAVQLYQHIIDQVSLHSR